MPLTCLVPASGKPPLERASIFTVVCGVYQADAPDAAGAFQSILQSSYRSSGLSPNPHSQYACPSQLV